MATETIGIGARIDALKLGGFQKLVIALCYLLCFVKGFDANSAGYVAHAMSKAWKLQHKALGLFFSLGLFGTDRLSQQAKAAEVQVPGLSPKVHLQPRSDLNYRQHPASQDLLLRPSHYLVSGLISPLRILPP